MDAKEREELMNAPEINHRTGPVFSRERITSREVREIMDQYCQEDAITPTTALEVFARSLVQTQGPSAVHKYQIVQERYKNRTVYYFEPKKDHGDQIQGPPLGG